MTSQVSNAEHTPSFTSTPEFNTNVPRNNDTPRALVNENFSGVVLLPLEALAQGRALAAMFNLLLGRDVIGAGQGMVIILQ